MGAASPHIADKFPNGPRSATMTERRQKVTCAEPCDHLLGERGQIPGDIEIARLYGHEVDYQIQDPLS
jgi:hypothetical protein